MDELSETVEQLDRLLIRANVIIRNAMTLLYGTGYERDHTPDEFATRMTTTFRDFGPNVIDQLARNRPVVSTEQVPPEPLTICPFCKGTPKLYIHELAGVPELEPSYQVECSDCGGCGPGYDDVKKSVRYWNNACG